MAVALGGIMPFIAEPSTHNLEFSALPRLFCALLPSSPPRLSPTDADVAAVCDADARNADERAGSFSPRFSPGAGAAVSCGASWREGADSWAEMEWLLLVMIVPFLRGHEPETGVPAKGHRSP